LRWDEVAECDPADFNVQTVPQRFEKLGDPHAEMDAHAGSLEKLLELANKDEAEGLGDAPWPPHFQKMAGEAPRVAPSRARSAAKKSAAKPKRTKMPLIVVANSPDKKAALDGLERWKKKHPKVAKLLAVDDVLVDSRSSVPRRRRLTRTTIPHASGAKLIANDLSNLWMKRSTQSHAAARPRAAHTCSLPVFYQSANDETALCDETDRPAYARMRLQPRAPGATAPTKDPCRDSNDSVRPERD
jgi:hypothetical protein